MHTKIPVAEPEIGKEELRKVVEGVKSGWVSSKGPFIEEFEEAFSKYIGVKHGVATSNGTTALHLALTALRIGRGDEVIVPTLTFIATANAVKYTSAKPVFVDSHPDYWCVDPAKLEQKITKRTKAIIVVHLYGHPCDMDPIVEIAEKYNLYVVEDCAEAHGAEYKGRKVGSFGIISCFSFYGNKIITTGEGGICLTYNDDLAYRMRILRDHGMNPNKKYWHDILGFNYRMTNLQAALGVAQLDKIDRFISKRREIARIYKEELKVLDGISPAPEMPWARNVYWLYSILLHNKDKKKVIEEMLNRDIETRPLFYPIHSMPPYRLEESFPISEQLSRKGLSLPSSTKLSTDNVMYVVKSLRAVLEKC